MLNVTNDRLEALKYMSGQFFTSFDIYSFFPHDINDNFYTEEVTKYKGWLLRHNIIKKIYRNGYKIQPEYLWLLPQDKISMLRGK